MYRRGLVFKTSLLRTCGLSHFVKNFLYTESDIFGPRRTFADDLNAGYQKQVSCVSSSDEGGRVLSTLFYFDVY